MYTRLIVHGTHARSCCALDSTPQSAYNRDAPTGVDTKHVYSVQHTMLSAEHKPTRSTQPEMWKHPRSEHTRVQRVTL